MAIEGSISAPVTGDPVMVCKHCDAWREIADEDEI